jgi:hypothetical protein
MSTFTLTLPPSSVFNPLAEAGLCSISLNNLHVVRIPDLHAQHGWINTDPWRRWSRTIAHLLMEPMPIPKTGRVQQVTLMSMI